MRIGLISSAYPPDFDGIGDHTWWLAKALARELHSEHEMSTAYASRSGAVPGVMVFTRIGRNHKPQPGVQVSRFFDPEFPVTFSALRETIQGDYANPNETIDWLVLQYNPFGWGRRGYCPKVPWTLRRLRETPDAPRIAVMFHETTAPPWPLKFAVMCLWQRPIFRGVCRAAEIAFVSTQRWTPQVKRMAPLLPVHRLPAGSNIPLSDVTQADARRRLGIDANALVLGVFGAAHVSRRLDWVAAAVAEMGRSHMGRRVILSYVGPHGNEVRRFCPDAGLIDAGPLPAEEVGVHLRAMDAVLSPFIDGISTRRTSVISVLHHGVPVATTHTPWTDDVFTADLPSAILLSQATSPEAFARETAEWIRKLSPGGVPNTEVQAFHDRFFRWPEIASSLLGHLPG